MARARGSDDKIVIKKYANRRLYNTETSSYVTLEHLCQMVKDGREFVVYDAKTSEDITRAVLTQIIFEEESKGANMLPINFLRQLIKFYGDSLQMLVPGYLDMSMEHFTRHQEQMRSNLSEAFGGMFPFKQMEEMGRQNMAIFQKAMAMMNPFVAAKEAEGGSTEGNGPLPGAGGDNERDELSRLREQMARMQSQLDALTSSKK